MNYKKIDGFDVLIEHQINKLKIGCATNFQHFIPSSLQRNNGIHEHFHYNFSQVHFAISI